MKILSKFVDNRRTDSLATKLRKRRFGLFKFLISDVPRPLSILDVGGTQMFWEMMGFTDEHDVEIVLLNLTKAEVTHPNFRSVVGDARMMGQFRDKEFDVVFSNSVIEHVGGYEQQRQMAEEVRRVGKRYFLQTPNYFFPIEPHFLFPFFQFFPMRLKVFYVHYLNIGWHGRIPDKERAMQVVNQIRLLTQAELKEIFSGATIYKEKFFCLTKSFIIYDGWEATSNNTR